jgi:hypothetical protein
MRIDLSTCRDPDLLAAEVRRLRAAITALADQDATLSVQDGHVIVTMDATLTDEEREAIERGIDSLVGVEDVSADAGPMDDAAACTLRGLIERLA